MGNFPRALITAGAVGAACAVLSVVVVLRRWAFIGEGIAHAGFGGIGTGWLLSLALPVMAGGGAVYAVAVLFCLAVAAAIGYVTYERDGRGGAGGGESFGADSAIGIFLVASLAWGFLALAIYNRHHPGDAAASAGAWEDYLFGTMDVVSVETMRAGVAIAAAVVVCVAALFKEILYYAFDPLMAHVSGVRTRFVHYLLMLLLAMVIVVGMRIAGNVLVTALLVLPGATAMLLSRDLRTVLTVSVGVSVAGCLAGPIVSHSLWRTMPSGPGIVLALFAEFVLAYAWSRVSRLRRAARAG